jgi:hypothetical protein
MRSAAPLLRGAPALLALALLTACASTPAVDPRYRPTENVIEVVALLRQHVPDDTYRFEPARDFTGRDVYRSSLLRLENIERVHAEALRAGHLDGVIAFSKGRALERLRAFDLAAQAYRLSAQREPELAAEALRSAQLCEAIERANALGIDLADLAGGGPNPLRAGADLDPLLGQLEQRVALFEGLQATAPEHYPAVIHEEIERADLSRARAFRALRQLQPDGDLRAVAELQRVVVRHRESKNAARHLLELADLYGELAEAYVAANPPAGLSFDPAEFQELTDGASRLYEIVAARDGTVEKLEAARRLEAFLAFALQVDRDRFTP